MTEAIQKYTANQQQHKSPNPLFKRFMKIGDFLLITKYSTVHYHDYNILR